MLLMINLSNINWNFNKKCFQIKYILHIQYSDRNVVVYQSFEILCTINSRMFFHAAKARTWNVEYFHTFPRSRLSVVKLKSVHPQLRRVKNSWMSSYPEQLHDITETIYLLHLDKFVQISEKIQIYPDGKA